MEREGFSWDSLPTENVTVLKEICIDIFAQNSRKFGIRNAVNYSTRLRELVDHLMLPIAQRHLHANAFLVRSTLFDKPSEANWAVPWHQDVTIEVSEKWETEGYGPWSIKDGLLSVQPPASILENMLTLRLHFDDTDETNGALLVEPGSHLKGKVPIEKIHASNPVACCCKAGDILLMKPLLFHASNRSVSTEPRRVLHLDFAFEQLRSPLRWRRG